MIFPNIFQSTFAHIFPKVFQTFLLSKPFSSKRFLLRALTDEALRRAAAHGEVDPEQRRRELIAEAAPFGGLVGDENGHFNRQNGRIRLKQHI